MNMERMEKILSKILETVESGNGAGEEVLGTLFVAFYEDMVKKYRPVLRALPDVADKVAADLVPVIQVFVRLLNALESDPSLQKELAVYKNHRAKNRFDDFKIYQKAGFTRHEAMQLVLQDIANFGAQRQGLSKVKELASSKK